MRHAHLPATTPLRLTLPVIAVAVLLTVHLGLAGYVMTHWRWSIAAATLLAAKALLLSGFQVLRTRRKNRRARIEAVG